MAARKPRAPGPGKPGAAIEWMHVTVAGEAAVRTGVVVGGAPVAGPGHKNGVWVVPDEAWPTDPYHGGMVVAEIKQFGRWALPAAVVEYGGWFSEDSDRTVTGSLAVTNGRASAIKNPLAAAA